MDNTTVLMVLNNKEVTLDNIDEFYFEALERNDLETQRKIASHLKIMPSMAMSVLEEDGKEALLELGYDLSRCEAEYGKDWLDKYAK